MKLNNKTIRGLTLAGKTDLIVFDDDMPGFGFRLRLSGSRINKTWIVQYRSHGRTRRVLIGSAEVFSAEEARAQAKKILGAVALGRDPQGERESARLKQAHTLKSIAESYLDARKDDLRPASHRVTKLYLTGNAYFGPLHSAAIGDITRADVAARINVIKRNSGMVTASRARSALSSLFVWAMGEGLAEANPVIGTNQPDTSEPRDRVLDGEELVAIWKASGDGEFGKVLKLLILLGARRQEIGGLKWSEINRAKCEWTLPKERAKNKHELTLPLPPLAREIIESVPEIVGRDNVFGARSPTGFCDWSRGKADLDQRLGDSLKAWRIHDIRRSVATHLADDLNVQPHVIECILGHYGGFRRGVTQVYNKSPYMNEMRAALEVWADHIRAIVEGGVRKVLAYPQASA